MTTPPSDDNRGPREHDLPPRPLSDRAAAYVAEAAMTDKAGRFDQRLSSVAADRRRRRQRARIAIVVGLAGAMVILGLIGRELAGTAGLFAGVAVVDLLVIGWIAMQRVLERTRGSSAWSWQSQRYVAIGNPSREVQKLDEPDRGAHRGA
jgi:hypothetical protein